jgi:hypothetical protein
MICRKLCSSLWSFLRAVTWVLGVRASSKPLLEDKRKMNKNIVWRGEIADIDRPLHVHCHSTDQDFVLVWSTSKDFLEACRPDLWP